MDTIGKRIKHLRDEKKLSQQAFAEKASISKGAIGKYENDQQVPGSSIIVAIGDAFDVEYRWLLTGKGPVYASGPAGLQDANKTIEKLELRIAELEAQIGTLKQGTVKKLQEELDLALAERDRAKEEAYNIMKAALKQHMPDLEP